MIFFIAVAILCACCVGVLWHSLLKRHATRASRSVAIMLAVIIPLASLGLYLQLGSINMPDFPYARLLSEQERETEKRLLEERPLIRALRADPQNEKLWITLITLYVETQRFDQARQAYQDAMQSVSQKVALRKIPADLFIEAK